MRAGGGPCRGQLLKSSTRSAGERGWNSYNIYSNLGMSAGVGGKVKFPSFFFLVLPGTQRMGPWDLEAADHLEAYSHLI